MKFNFGSTLRPSSFNKWPTEEDPDGRYKISSLVVHLEQNVSLIERKTYSCLEWLGDIGGLYDATKLIGRAIVYPVAFFSLQTELVTQAFGTN